MRHLLILIALLCSLSLVGCGNEKTADTSQDKFAGTWVSENHSMYIWPCGAKYILEYTHPSEDNPNEMATLKVPAEPRGSSLHFKLLFDELSIGSTSDGNVLVFQNRPFQRVQTVSRLD